MTYTTKTPLVISIKIHKDFYNSCKNGGKIPPKHTDEYNGTHAMLVIGWTETEWIIVNSWGDDYGDGGIGYLPFDNDIIVNFYSVATTQDVVLPIKKTYNVGWNKDKVGHFYSSDGYKKESGMKYINGKYYCFDEYNYAYCNTMFKYNDYSMYAKDDCSLATNEIVTIGENNYIFDRNARIVYGWYQLGNDWYYLSIFNGTMLHGWVVDQTGQSAFLDPKTGKMVKGWVSDNGNWYYLNEHGYMIVSDWKYIIDRWYYFDEDGVMQVGWLQLGNDWYYLNPKSDGYMGAMVTGWLKDKGYWYYLQSNGKMVSNCAMIIDGKTYKFNKDGQMI